MFVGRSSCALNFRDDRFSISVVGLDGRSAQRKRKIDRGLMAIEQME